MEDTSQRFLALLHLCRASGSSLGAGGGRLSWGEKRGSSRLDAGELSPFPRPAAFHCCTRSRSQSSAERL